ncbi:MAG: hypothetical protein NTY64_01000, partial [Deltaproteobacteria bacterium]|nr:hypothetical protein [Deltaproteobacteria bacterium]
MLRVFIKNVNPSRESKKAKPMAFWWISCLLLFSLPFFFPPEAGSEIRIKIGLLTPPDEAKAGLADAYLQGAEMAAAEVNSK